MLDFSLFKNRNFEKSDIKRLNLFLSLLETPINKKEADPKGQLLCILAIPNLPSIDKV